MFLNTATTVSNKEIGLVFIGGLFCLAGLLSNEYVSSIFVSTNWYEILPLRVRVALWIINISLVAWGSVTIAFRRKTFVINGNLILASLFIITPIAAELFIRGAIYMEIDYFRNPRLYVGWLDDDDHWKLRYLWGKSGEQIEGGGFVADPLLGWAPEKSSQNPLGILSNRPYLPDFSAKTVLFYGDSYVYGISPTPIEQRVPQQLDSLLSDYTVYNLGVVGYGVDQIFLRFQETHSNFERPFIIIGIYTLDIDRSILRVREMPKPYYELEDNQLALKGIPVSDSMEKWIEQHPVTIDSYLLAFFIRQYRIMSGGFRITEIPYRQQEKKLINAKIIEEIVSETRSHDLPLLFVVFYPDWEFEYEGWREVYLKNLFTRSNVPYIDTKQVFLQKVGSQPEQISQFYDARHGHLNELGGKTVAEAIAAYFGQYQSQLTKTN